MYKPDVTTEAVRELYESGTGFSLNDAARYLIKKQVMEDYDHANTLRKMDCHGIECQSFDIFDIIEYALFRMKK